jgi:O-antigen/teichoic acid export membrane protein
MSSQRVGMRFVVSFTGNIIKLSLSFFTGLIIARGLGPNDYGNFSFLLTSFLSLRQLLDMGTSQAFYTFISEKKRSKGFFKYYFLWVLLQLIITIMFIWILCPRSLFNTLWVGNAKHLVILAFLASFTMTQLWEMITSIGESIRDTFYIQVRNIAVAITYFVVVLALYYSGNLGIKELYILIISIYLSFSYLYYKKVNKAIINKSLSVSFNQVLSEYTKFCKPLVIYSWAGFAYTFLDNWMLQMFGGSEQQGFYSIGLRFTTLSLIATTSILRIFWKEIAEANENMDNAKIVQLYNRVPLLLYFAAAALSCFILPFTKEIIHWLLGQDYEDAWLPLTLLFILPLFQSLGQISGSFFIATRRVKLYTKLGLIIIISSFPITYVLIAKTEMLIPGFGLGAVGLALKIVILGIVEANLKMYFIAKILGIPYKWFYQIYIFVPLFLFGILGKYFSGYILSLVHLKEISLLWFATAALIYLFFLISTIRLFPKFIGLTRSEIDKFTNRVLIKRAL